MGPGDLHSLLSGLGADPKAGRDIRDAEDAGTAPLGRGELSLHTVDLIAPIVDDPACFGRIAAANSLSDVYAMGGQPTVALTILSLPKSLPPPAARRMLAAARSTLLAADTQLVGGHTVKGTELLLGFAVTGRVPARSVWRNRAARPGDRIFLSKPVGTGITYAAARSGAAKPALVRAAQASMVALNGPAAAVGRAAGIRCATDVTGFGLAGHALNVARASGVDLHIDPSVVPFFPGLPAAYAAVGETGAGAANRRSVAKALSGRGQWDAFTEALLFDPQTSGGLLMFAGPRAARRLSPHFPCIGRVAAPAGKRPRLRLSSDALRG